MTAILESTGDVLIESEISQSSFTSKGSGKREVDLGQGKKAGLGFFRVTAISGNQRRSLLIPILSAEEAIPIPKAEPLKDSEEALIIKFYTAIKTNGKAYVASWPARRMITENIVKVSTAGTLVLVCVADPSKVSCLGAAGASADLVFEGVFSFLEHATSEMEKAAIFSKEEARSMRMILKALRAAKTTVSVTLGSGVATKIVEGLDFVTLSLEEDSPVRLVFGLQKDSAGKAVKLIHVLQNISH